MQQKEFLTPLIHVLGVLELVHSNLPAEEVLDEDDNGDDAQRWSGPLLHKGCQERNDRKSLKGGSPEIMELLHSCVPNRRVAARDVDQGQLVQHSVPNHRGSTFNHLGEVSRKSHIDLRCFPANDTTKWLNN
jgi:hypothetical protein